MRTPLMITMITLVIHAAGFSQPPGRNPLVDSILSQISPVRMRATVEKLVSFGTRHTLSDTTSATRGIGAARRWILSQFEAISHDSHGRLSVEYQAFTLPPSRRIPRGVSLVNIAATLRPEHPTASSSDRIFAVGAHYDSRASDPIDSVSDAPGADDDASGVALVLELARLLSTHSFDAAIVFLCFAGEEQGLLGATQWAEMAHARGLNLEAMLNNDIVGNVVGGDGTRESTYVRLFSQAFAPADTGRVFLLRNSLGLENDGSSRSLARSVKDIAERYIRDFRVELIYREDRFLRGGDHVPFHQRGFAAVRLSEAKENFDRQHQNITPEDPPRRGDLPAFMNFDYLATIARVNAAVLATLASAPSAPSHPAMLTDRLEYSTRLSWDKNPEPDLAGYFVRYRKTATAAWEGSIFTRDTSLTLPISKDEYIFGIQAVDSAGNASLPALPMPKR